jgi:hypothetical protein
MSAKREDGPQKPQRGMLDLTRHNGGPVRCCAADCGWEGIPIYINGVASTYCPSCEHEDDDALMAEVDAEMAAEAARARGVEQRRSGAGVGRNDPCPCGSGQKHKKCCMA